MKVRRRPNTRIKLSIALLSLLCFAFNVNAQNKKPSKPISLELINKYKNHQLQVPDSLKTNLSLISKTSYLGIYHKELGVFCKLENSALKQNSIPIKMRLGDVKYVDNLESKNPAYQLPEPR